MTWIWIIAATDFYVLVGPGVGAMLGAMMENDPDPAKKMSPGECFMFGQLWPFLTCWYAGVFLRTYLGELRRLRREGRR